MGSALFFIAVLVVLGCLCGPVPIMLGLVALGRIEQSNGQLRGRGLAIGAIVLGILALLALPVLLIGGLLLHTAPASSMRVTSTISPPVMPSAVVSSPRGGMVITTPVVIPNPAATLTSEEYELQAEYAYGALYKKVDGELKDDPAAQVKAIKEFLKTYADTTVASRARRQLLIPRVAAMPKNGTDDTTDIVVPPDILAKANDGDHFETINPDAPAQTSEEAASVAYAALDKKLHGELANDTQAQISALEDFVKAHADTIVAARARVALFRLRQPAEAPETKEPK